jgi:hypothetical protein
MQQGSVPPRVLRGRLPMRSVERCACVAYSIVCLRDGTGSMGGLSSVQEEDYSTAQVRRKRSGLACAGQSAVAELRDRIGDVVDKSMRRGIAIERAGPADPVTGGTLGRHLRDGLTRSFPGATPPTRRHRDRARCTMMGPAAALPYPTQAKHPTHAHHPHQTQRPHHLHLSSSIDTGDTKVNYKKIDDRCGGR